MKKSLSIIGIDMEKKKMQINSQAKKQSLMILQLVCTLHQ